MNHHAVAGLITAPLLHGLDTNILIRNVSSLVYLTVWRLSEKSRMSFICNHMNPSMRSTPPYLHTRMCTATTFVSDSFASHALISQCRTHRTYFLAMPYQTDYIGCEAGYPFNKGHAARGRAALELCPEFDMVRDVLPPELVLSCGGRPSPLMLR